MIVEHDQVALTRRLPELGLMPGDVGVADDRSNDGSIPVRVTLEDL